MASQLLIFGASGCSKTTTCGQFHRYQAVTTGKAGVHATIDSTAEPMQDEINEGMVRVWNLAQETPAIGSSIVMALNALAKGFVPAHLGPNGERLSAHWIEHEGALSIEGLWMLSQALKAYFVQERGMVNGSYMEADGSLVGSAQVQIYDLTQQRLIGAVNRLRGNMKIPRVLWTSHEAKGADAVNQSTVLGPAILPLKGLDRVPANFAHALRLQSIEITNETGQPEGVKLLHFEPHLDTTMNLPWPCKTSLTPRRLARLRAFASQASGNRLPGALLCRIGPTGQLMSGLPQFLQILDSND